MASLGTSFNPTEHDTEQRADFENLPDGDYVLEVETADVKITDPDSPRTRKVGVKVTYQVIEPEDYKGRKVFDYFNLEHPTAQAQTIGQSQFAALCRAMGISDPVSDTDDLMFKSFTAKIGMGKPSKEKDANGVPTYPAKNEIKKFYFPDEGQVPAAKAAPRPTAAANGNRAAANDNGQKAAPAAGEAPKRPWGAKK